jgi:hypothetical protein
VNRELPGRGVKNVRESVRWNVKRPVESSVRTVETASSTDPCRREVWWVRAESSIIVDAAIRVGVVAARSATQRNQRS